MTDPKIIGSVDMCIENGNDAQWCRANCKPITLDTVQKGDSIKLMKCLPNDSIDLIVTSPPYANLKKKYYNSIHPDDYVEWFLPFATELKRVLKPTGSFVLNIKENVINGERHPYVMDLVNGIRGLGWIWNETYMWVKPNPFPRKPRKRLKDGFEYIYHFTKTKDFKFHPKRVMKDGDPSRCKGYKKALSQGKQAFNKVYGEYTIKHKNLLEFGCDKAYPSNVLTMAIGARTKAKHPAQFPAKLPRFFIQLMSDEGDVVLDPFAGGATTNIESKKLCRPTLGFDLNPDYIGLSNGALDSVECERGVL